MSFLSFYSSQSSTSLHSSAPSLLSHPHAIKHYRHPWLWSYNIHFCHLCLSALVLPQGDNELRAVTDKFLFCSWCWVKQRDVELQQMFDVVHISMLQQKSKTEGKKRQTDTSSELIYSLLCQITIFMAEEHYCLWAICVCEWMKKCVYVDLCTSLCV